MHRGLGSWGNRGKAWTEFPYLGILASLVEEALHMGTLPSALGFHESSSLLVLNGLEKMK